MIVDLEDEQDIDRLESDYRTARPPEPLFYLVGFPWQEIPTCAESRSSRERAFCRLLQVMSDRDADASNRMETVALYCLSDFYTRDEARPRRSPIIVNVLRLLARVLPPATLLWVQSPDENGSVLELERLAASPWLYVQAHLTLVFANPFVG